METNNKKKSPRKRARTPEGKFKGDNPLTPDVNEAWESTEVVEALPKTNPYSVKQKVSGISKNTAGKYSKQSKTKPTFGSVTTKLH